MISGTPAGADYLTAVASILSAIAWPAVILTVVLVFRRALKSALDDLIEFRMAGARAKFKREGGELATDVLAATLDTVAETSGTTGPSQPSEADAAPSPAPPRASLRSRYAQRAEDNPLNAIIQAYSAIELWYRDALTSHGIDFRRPDLSTLSVTEMSDLAIERGLLPASTRQQVDGLTIMRDLAVHGPEREVTASQAREFLLLSDGLIYALNAALAKSDNERAHRGDDLSAEHG